ncbi:hypothetical protein FRC07_006433, partial [Ceratobasidium sp. 392]
MALNPDEKRIVRHQGTSVVIGRSGTGKTTALIYKLRANAQAAAMLGDDNPIRQLFVTKSRVLTQHIARNYHGLLESSEIANKSREELAEIRQQNEKNRKRELVEFDNEVDLRDDLLDRYSLLRDSHFPLFISYDKLCSLLLADIESLQEEYTKQPPITFDDFKYNYWPKLKHGLTYNLDPGLVFSEILGVIKGYGENLSKDDYVSNLTHKKSPLLAHARDRVYAIFEAYSTQALVQKQIDTADRTRLILNAHDSNPLPDDFRVNYIFVDEVQDQLMIDIHLLQSLCSNPNGGYWCGDTAQTISVGSSFRIKDLKSFIYHDMLSYRKADSQRKAPAPFSTFELSVNFRSHGGIVRYAASLVELIYTLFPNSIDHMAPETARTPGPAPLLFISPDDDEGTFVRYLLGSRPADQSTPFGAHQAIIAFWTRFDQVEIAGSLQKVESFAVSSEDLQEWTKRGQEFFSSGLYALAKSCFERAGQSKEAEIADAYYHMSEAKRTRDKHDHLKAAMMMEECAKRTDVEDSNNVLWYHSAASFESARDIPNASRAYRNGKFYDRAASVSFEHQNFDDTLLTLLPYSGKMDISSFEKIRDVSRMHYLRTSNYDKLRKLFEGDQNACIEYARSSGFSVQLKDLLKESSRFEDLANVHLSEGSPAEAAQCLLKSSTHPSTINRVEKIASEYLWLNLSLDATPDTKISQQASQLFKILSRYTEMLGGLMTFDLNLFKASLGHLTIELDALDDPSLQQAESKHRLVLGYHHALQNSPWTHANLCNAARIFPYLNAWRIYAENIYAIIEHPNPSQAIRIQQLLGCSVPTKKPRTGTFVHIATSSLLYGCAKDQRQIHIDKKTSRGENLVAGADADRLIRYELSERLKSRLLAFHSELLDSVWMNPSAIPSAGYLTGVPGATSGALTLEDHMRVASMGAKVLYPIRACSTERLSSSSNKVVRHAWVIRLFNLFNPPTGMICNASALSQPPTDQTGERCLRDWVNEFIWLLKSTTKRPELCLSAFVMSLSVSYELDNRSVLQDFKTPYLSNYPRPLLGCGHSSELRSVTADIFCLFGHEDHPRVAKSICVLGYIVQNKLKIDLAVLVYLMERITREAIVAERATVSPHWPNGISGLAIPLSWAKSLISYPRLSPNMFDAGLIGDLVLCIGGVIRRIKDGVLAHWKTPSTELWRHSVSSLSLRILASLSPTVIINLHPSHPALRTALDVLQRDVENLGNRFECEALRGGNGDEDKIET